MKLTLRIQQRDGTVLATWNGKPVAIDAIAREISGLPEGTTIEAECRYEPGGVVATHVLGAVRRAYDVPGFEAAAEARKHYEAGRPEEACRVLEAARALPFDGLLLHASLNRSPSVAERLLLDVLSHPSAKDHDVVEVAHAALHHGVDRVTLRELLGERLRTSALEGVAQRVFDGALSDAPRWWVERELERFASAPLSCVGVVRTDWVDASESQRGERLTRAAQSLAYAANAHGIAVDASELEAAARTRLAATEQEERDEERRQTEHARRALARLEKHAGRALPSEFAERWMRSAADGRDPSFRFLSLARYFEDPSYGAWRRLEGMDLTDRRWLVFGAQDGTDELPPYYALDTRTAALAVYELDREQAIERRIANALTDWDGWRA